MWERLHGLRSVRPWLGALILFGLAGCATQRAAPAVATSPAAVPAGERDATGAYRFNMTQHGRRMSADEFDAWMKARGIRVAKGAPADAGKPVPASPRVAQAGKAKSRGIQPIAAAGAKPAPAKVPQAPDKAKPTGTAIAAGKNGARKAKPTAPAKPVETASLEAGPPKSKPVKRGEG